LDHIQAIDSPYEKDISILQLRPQEAIEVVMDRYGDEIKRFIYTYLHNTADTDDVTQEVFITIYRKLNTYQGKSSLRSWIYSIAINKCKDHLKSFHQRSKRLRDKLTQSSANNEMPAFTPENHVIQTNESTQLLMQVLALPIKYREIIVLYYFKDFSTTEISRMLKMSEATVRTRLKRGREKLKENLVDWRDE
jgi:RNA polymerase sigma factor (sigma-70 family)